MQFRYGCHCSNENSARNFYILQRILSKVTITNTILSFVFNQKSGYGSEVTILIIISHYRTSTTYGPTYIISCDVPCVHVMMLATSACSALHAMLLYSGGRHDDVPNIMMTSQCHGDVANVMLTS